MLNWFKKSPLLDQNSVNWLFDCFSWCLQQFNANTFQQQTTLVLPTNDFFAGKVNSVASMSELVFKQVQQYAGLDSTAFKLVQPGEIVSQPQLTDMHVAGRTLYSTSQPELTLPIGFAAAQLNKPQDLIANFIVQMCQYLVWFHPKKNPGGSEFNAPASDLLAVVMGFGLPLANSAYTFRGSCGSCFNAQANRQAALSENETLFALALFAELKQIEKKQILRHLKPYLRPLYKQACHELTQDYQQELVLLKQSAFSPAS